ncbi:MAG: DNA-directed RNA polymerase subunit P [Candidatus Woesearchaeota archaeon]
MVYVCQNCSKSIKEDQIRHRVICPYCSSRILFKARSLNNKPVKAR